MIKLFGSSLSPYVRKVLLLLAHKQMPFEFVPVDARAPTPEFLAISPLRKFPVLVEGSFSLPDSSAICRYLEDVQPQPPLFPANVRTRAYACWIEEYADTNLVDIFAPLLGERVFLPKLFGKATDTAHVAHILDELAPPALGYLETQAPASGFVCGELSIADISIGSVFINAGYGGFRVDPACHPRLSGWVERVMALPIVQERCAQDRRDYGRLLFD